MKKYIEPKVIRLDLNAEQAILQVCAISGYYFDGGTAGSFCVSDSGNSYYCNFSGRNGKGLTGGDNRQVQSIPS